LSMINNPETSNSKKDEINKRLIKKHSKKDNKNKDNEQVYKVIAEKRTKIPILAAKEHINYYQQKTNICDSVDDLIAKYNCMKKVKEN
jgi:hypothetical protein